MGVKKASTKRCLYCRKKMPGDGRSNGKYCKPGCRTMAYRARQLGRLEVDEASLASILSASGATQTDEAGSSRPLPVVAAARTVEQRVDSSATTSDIANVLHRRHKESTAALQQLLALAREQEEREERLRLELAQTQEALRARTDEAERLQSEVTKLREQAAKREQVERNEEEIRLRLLQVERYVAVLTEEQRHRQATNHAQLDEQLQTNESLRAELATSLSRTHELDATVQRLRQEQAEQSERLAASQHDLAAMQRILANQEAEQQRLQRECTEQHETAERTTSEHVAQRATLEADVARLQRAVDAQQVTIKRQADAMSAREILESISAAKLRGSQEQGERLTAERDGATARHQQLLATVRGLVPFPFGSPTQLWGLDADVRTRLKNPLGYFLEKILPQDIPDPDNNVRRLALLFVQGRISAVMALGSNGLTDPVSEALVKYVSDSVRINTEFYSDEFRSWVETHESKLRMVEQVTCLGVVRQMRRAFGYPSPT